MNVAEAFDIFQTKVDADPLHVLKARNRRDIFSVAFNKLEDVTNAIPSGSLARKTQLDPIHDVDLIITFDAIAHPDWGKAGDSAAQALEYCQDQVRQLLGDQSSALQRVVGQTTVRNHVVKCLLDPRFMTEDPGFKGSFAVEVMPALRTGHTLLVPEKKKRAWQTADPEWLITEVHKRQVRWQYLVQMIRVVKFWMRNVGSGVKPLAAEVLALKCLPDSVSENYSRSFALQRFFTAACPSVMTAIRDPAGHCGEIQPDLNRPYVSALLREASDIATIAVGWEMEGEHHKAICCWRTIFGDKFPLPPGGCPGSSQGNGGGASRATNAGMSGGGQVGEDTGHRSGGEGSDPHLEGGSTPEGPDSNDDARRPPGFVPLVPPLIPPSPSRRVKDAPQG